MSAYASRIERLRALFDEAKIDGVLISQPESRFYLSGYTGHDLPPRDSAGYLMIGKSGALLADRPAHQRAGRERGARTTRWSPTRRTPATGQRLVESVQELGITKLGFESIHLPYAIWQSFSEAVGEKGYEAADGTEVPAGRRDGPDQGSGRQAPDHQGHRRDVRPPGRHRRAGRLLHAPGQERAAGRADREGDRPGRGAVPPEPRPHHLVPVDRRERPERLDAARRPD